MAIQRVGWRPYMTTQVVNAVDADATAFIAAAGITNLTQASAINTLVTQLKTYGIWTKLKAFYPIVGGSAASHKFNLKDPRDLDAAYRLTFFGGLTHDSNGILGNGTNAYAYTNLPQNTFGAHNMSAGWYNMNDLANLVVHRFAIGGTYTTMQFRYFDGFLGEIQRLSGTSNTFTNNTTQKGMYILSRQNSTQSLAYKNGVLNNTTSNTGVNDLTNRIITLFAKDNGSGTNSAPTVSFYGNWHGNCIFFADGMNGTEVANISTAINKFNSTLNRNVFPISVSDSDAQSFLNAANITNLTQATAINTLVTDLKSAGIWTKMKAIYPFVGGTAFAHKFNLKDPRDLDAAYRLVFNGGGVHSSTGYQLNGSNSWADTKLIPSNILSSNGKVSLGFYSRTNRTGANRIAMGSFTVPTSGLMIYPRFTDNKAYFGLADDSSGNAPSVTSTLGFYQGARNNSTTQSLSNINGNNYSYNYNTTSLPNTSVFIGTINSNPTAYVDNLELAFSYVGEDLSATDLSNYYTAVQTYQTTLGRQV